MTSLDWVFDRAGASGQRKGGKSTDQIVGNKLGTLVREATQNSRDQRLDNGQPVRVRFSLITLSGERKEKFLHACNWEQLGLHIDEAVKVGQKSPFSKQLKNARARIDSDDLLLLRIDDYNSNGLLGGELEEGKNFKNLCKDEFVTPEKVGRGGSYGVGKAVYHRFSSVSAVIYSSFVDGPVDGVHRSGMRLFGRTQLSSHKLEEVAYTPDGWFGIKDGEGYESRAISVWDDTELCEELLVDRDPAEGRGTSILVVGLFDPEAGTNDVPDPSSFAQRIIEETEKWFWPSISGAEPTMSVEVRVIKDGSVLETYEAEPEKRWSHFIRSLNAPKTGETAEKQDEVAELPVSFRIPERNEDPKHKAFDTELRLRVTREPPSSKENMPELGSVALIRGFGMVVKYYRPSNTPLSSDPYCGVLLAGEAANQGTGASDAEEFFRSSEPPLHDAWLHDMDAVRENYSAGAGVAFKTLWSEASEKVVKLCGIPKPKDDTGPKLLSRLMPFAKAEGEGPKKHILVKDVEANLSPAGWEVAGRIMNTKFEDKPWSAHVFFYLQGEKGRGDGLAFKTLNPTSGKVTDFGPRAVIEIPATTSEIEFSGLLDTSSMTLAELKRIKLGYVQ